MSEKNAPALIRGNILAALVRFALPVLLALFLQAMYGAADLIIVGRFAGTAEQSGVASGSQLFNLITMMITGLSMGVTVLVGNAVGSGEKQLAGRAVGCGAVLFGLLALVITALVVPFAGPLAGLLHAPAEAYEQTAAYLRICGLGTVFITAYNVLGAVFRGLGDSKTPLLTVAIACGVNIVGDLVLVQGIVGAFCVRIPVVYLMSHIPGVGLFEIGLGTPISSVVQILLCIAAYRWYQSRAKQSA